MGLKTFTIVQSFVDSSNTSSVIENTYVILPFLKLYSDLKSLSDFTPKVYERRFQREYFCFIYDIYKHKYYDTRKLKTLYTNFDHRVLVKLTVYPYM